jgi:hypothetical protein
MLSGISWPSAATASVGAGQAADAGGDDEPLEGVPADAATARTLAGEAA